MKTRIYKRGLAFTLTIMMVFTTMFGGFSFLGINGGVEEAYAEATYTEYYENAPAGTIGAATTYAISTEQQLRDLATTVTSGSGTTYQYTTFELTTSIAITNSNWVPIGKNGRIFSGIFDGKGKTISGSITNATQEYFSLFGYASGSAIKNLRSCVEISSSFDGAKVGGLVGTNQGTIENCYVKGNVIISTIGTDVPIVGGLVGHNSIGGLIENSYATGDVTVVVNADAGGLVGYNSAKIINCYATGNVTVGNMALAGGLVGLTGYSGGTIENSYATGNITGGTGAHVGGLVGNIGGGTVESSFWNSDATQTISGAAVANKLAVGGSGTGSNVSATSKASVLMQSTSFAEELNANLDILRNKTLYKWESEGGYPTFSDNPWSAIAVIPEPPTSVSATGGDGQATVSFTAPGSNGGAVITGYTVTSNPGGFTGTGGTSPIIVNGLTNGIAYNFTVTATNRRGSSVASSASNSVTPIITSGGGSGGGGGGTTASTVINTNTGAVTGDQLKDASGASGNGGTVTINSDKTDEVLFPTSGLDALKGKNNSLTIITDNGTLTFDSKAVNAMNGQASGEDIKVIVADVDKTKLTEEQKSKVGDKEVYDLTVMSGGKLISDFKGGKVNVSIPYELKAGETSDNITVWYMADDGSLTEIKCTYDEKTKSVTFIVDHFSKYIIGYSELDSWMNPFTDVKGVSWYYDAVAYVNMKGLMKGQSTTMFDPQGTMTRGMFVTILGRMEGISTVTYENVVTFSDVVSSQYYAPYITWASDKKIVDGVGGGKFAPDKAVTREEMAVMITNYMKFKGQGPIGSWAIQLKYSDLNKVSSWAGEGVMFMTMKGLMSGMGNDANGSPVFAPELNSTRAQTAQVIMNLGELLK